MCIEEVQGAWGRGYNILSYSHDAFVHSMVFNILAMIWEFLYTLQGVVIKYNEPEEARIPKIRWRLYQFKGDETLRRFLT